MLSICSIFLFILFKKSNLMHFDKDRVLFSSGIENEYRPVNELTSSCFLVKGSASVASIITETGWKLLVR